MKIEPRRTEHVLGDALAWRGFVLHGEDHGLIRERAIKVAGQVVPDKDDPFRVVVLDREDHARLEEEATALSLIGGRRLIWVRDVQDHILPMLQRALYGVSDNVILLEAPGLASRSKLRSAMEKRQDVAVIACYPEEGRSLSVALRTMFDAAQVRVDRDAMAWLSSVLPADRAVIRQEVEKLILFAEPSAPLSLDDVQLCIGDTRAESLSNATSSALAGERAQADAAIERAIADGAVPVAIVRACSYALLRVLTVRHAMDEGASPSEAERGLRPPIFFKVADLFWTAVRRWDSAALLAACSATQELELACKQTGAPDFALARRHIARLCFGPRAFSA
ncbi:MAG: DNA polymerase III subunit delta [Acetobacteraceae bacterium]